MKKQGYSLLAYEDLTAKIRKGHFCEHTWLSPRWGYKRGYKYNQQVYIYLTSQLKEGGWLDVLYFQNANRKYILKSIKEFKETSRAYQRATK